MHRLAYPLLLILSFLPLVGAAIVFMFAPDTIPMHIGMEGIDRYGDKSELFLLGGIGVGTNLLMFAFYAFADKLHALGLLNVPGNQSNAVRMGRLLLAGTIVFLDVLFVGIMFMLAFGLA